MPPVSTPRNISAGCTARWRPGPSPTSPYSPHSAADALGRGRGRPVYFGHFFTTLGAAMQSAAEARRDHDVTDVPSIVAGAVRLGLFESVVVLLFSLGSRLLDPPLETIVLAPILLVGLAGVTLLPGLWTRPRTIEGIAGAAGIGLGATAVFLLVDVVLLQNIGTYTNRWYEIGGGSNWWYHPVWWMVGTFIPWMGAWLLANQTNRNGRPSVGQGFLTVLVLSVLIGVAATLLGFPGAHWGLGTFAVAFLPGLALATLFSGIGKRRT